MRKPDPERIYQARRAAHFRHRADVHGLDELDAEHWLREMGTRGEGTRRRSPFRDILAGRRAMDRRAAAGPLAVHGANWQRGWLAPA